MILLAVFFSALAFAQTAKDKLGLSAFPQESIYVHYNSSLFLTGEYIYYSVYCLDRQSRTFSNLSKIAYVELINDEGNVVFKHKIKLENGRGQGDFFIPSDTPSGSCKLFGYTQFMRNGPQEDFFQGNVIVVNPYTNNQQKFRGKSETVHSNESVEKSNVLSASLNKDNFNTRDKVTLQLKAFSTISTEKSFSVSVRKKDEITTPLIPTAKFHIRTITSKAPITLKKQELLPELRGELISGKALSNVTSKTLSNESLVVSIPDDDYFFSTIKTDEKGNFYINLFDYGGDEIFFQGLGTGNELKVALNTHEELDIDNTPFYQFNLDQDMRKTIVQRSIRNQIENNYFSFKPDSVKIQPKKVPFYGNVGESYILDEYTRFKTFRETVIEILRSVTIKRVGGDEKIEVDAYFEKDNQSGFLPLILVDGYYTQDYEKLLEFDARKIEKISVLSGKYVMGPQVFQGVIDIATFDENYTEFLDYEQRNRFSLFAPQPRKYYFNQVYGDENNAADRIPDFRHQLLWNPNITMVGETNTIEFFTSDVEGEYEISIEGFTSDLKPISLKETFEVK